MTTYSYRLSKQKREIFMAKRKKAKSKARKTTRKVKRKSGTKRKSGLTVTQYNLSPELEAVVGSKKLTRPQVVKKLWVYIKAHKLQDAKNRRMINPDKKLGEVIGNRPIDMLKLAGALSKHIK